MTENSEPATIAASAVGRTLLKALADELEKQTKAWRDLSEIEQHQALERMRQSVRLAVTDALRVIFGQDMPAVPATLDNLGSKGTISMRLTVAKGAANRHELLDAVGTQVVILIGNPEEYLEGLSDLKAKAQQPGLFDAPELPPLESDDLGHSDEPEPDDTPTPEPTPAEIAEADEAQWVETARDRSTEQNITTGKTRVSRWALGQQLLDKLTTWNADPKHLNIRFNAETIVECGRGELLMALTWFDAYIAGTDAEPPPFLIPESPAP